MKTIIDDFLQNEKEIYNFLDRLANRYRLNDFVIVDRATKEFLLDKGKEGFEGAHGCIFYYRLKQLRLDYDSVENRLIPQYLDFLWMVLTLEEDKDKVKYILAYHYLEMIEQLTFKLTISSDAPFLFGGDMISPRGKMGYDSYKEIKYGMLSQN